MVIAPKFSYKLSVQRIKLIASSQPVFCSFASGTSPGSVRELGRFFETLSKGVVALRVMLSPEYRYRSYKIRWTGI